MSNAGTVRGTEGSRRETAAGPSNPGVGEREESTERAAADVTAVGGSAPGEGGGRA